jgi:voltage-gated potassium channel
VIQLLITLRRLLRAIVNTWRRDPQFRTLTILVLVMLLSGTTFYYTVEGWSVVDAFYFCVTTLTTVGLGDLAPHTTLGKLFTTVYIFAGLGLLAGFLNTVAKATLLRGKDDEDAGKDDEDTHGG